MIDLASDKGAHVDRRLRADQIVWVGTVRADGRPHAVPVWFWWDGDAILIFTKADSQKARNLGQNPNVVLALDDTKGGGDVVIIERTAELLSQSSAEVSPAAYFEKYAAGIAGIGTTPDQLMADYRQAIRVRPTRLVSW